MKIYIAVVETSTEVRPFAARLLSDLYPVVYREFISGRMEGLYDPDEAAVRALAASGDFEAAVRTWFDEVGSVPMVNTDLTILETDLTGASDRAPEVITVGVTRDAIYGPTAVPAVRDDLLFHTLYHGYVAPRLNTGHAGENQVRHYVGQAAFDEAVWFWFTVIGPHYSENGEIACRLSVATDVPLH